MQTEHSTLTRPAMKRIFKQFHGSQSKLARELEVSPVTVCRWLLGEIRSKRLDKAIPARAARLLAKAAK